MHFRGVGCDYTYSLPYLPYKSKYFPSRVIKRWQKGEGSYLRTSLGDGTFGMAPLYENERPSKRDSPKFRNGRNHVGVNESKTSP